MVPFYRGERFGLRISLLLPLVWMLSLVLGRVETFYLTFLCVTLHEGAHAALLLAFGMRVDRIDLTPVGAFLTTSAAPEHRPGAEAAMAFAGPALNLLFAGLSDWGRSRGFFFPQADLFIRINLALALGNLLPALPLDGGHLLRAALTRHMGLGASSKAVAIVGYVLSAAFVAGGAYLWLRTGWPRAELFLFPACIVSASLAAQRSAAWLGVREAEGKREELRRQGLLPVKSVVVDGEMPLATLLPRLSPRCYYLFTVVDEEGEALGSFTEEALLSSLRGEKALRAGEILRSGACKAATKVIQ